jgi:hypothetical protein
MQAPTAESPAGNTDEPYPSQKTAHFSLFVMTIVVMFTVLDRQVLALMIEPVKKDFGISDTQAALLLGAAFSLTYAIAAISSRPASRSGAWRRWRAASPRIICSFSWPECSSASASLDTVLRHGR